MTEAGIIDLGDMRERPEVGARPPGVRRRPLLAAAVLAGVPAVLGGSARVPGRLPGTRVPAAPTGFLTVDRQRVYVMGMAAGRRGLTVAVAAYRLADGAPVWRSETGVTGASFGGFARFGDALLLMELNQDQTLQQLTALEAATGVRLWRRQGQLSGWTAAPPGATNRVLLGAGWYGGAGEPKTITAVDLRTGAVVWSHSLPPGAQVAMQSRALGTGAEVFITDLPSGRLEVREAATARLLASAAVRDPVPATAPEPGTRRLLVADDMIMVVGAERETLTAYGVRRLERRWTVRWPGSGSDWYTGFVCVGVLGVQSATGGWRGLDHRTGRVLWERPWAYLAPVGSMLLGVRTERVAGAEGPLALVDPATGRQRRALGSWALVQRPSAGTDVLLVRRSRASGRSLLAVLEPGAADPRVVGVLPEDARACVTAQDSVVCRRAGSAVGIWRYR